ncbi:MAG: hypothetical protein IVW55_16895, partial [Chloroflexi bacterium]|nr:hypothetical protein [Chloroflexota bacterium]
MKSSPGLTVSKKRASGMPALLFFGLLLCSLAALAMALPHGARAGMPTGSLAQPSDPGAPTKKVQRPPQSAQRAASGKALPYESAPQARPRLPARTGGPDAFGYVFADDRDPGGPSYNYQPASNRIADAAWKATPYAGTPLDDGVITTTLPFAFSFYGSNYTSMHISTNGNVHFGPPNNYFTNAQSGRCIPSNSQYVPQAMIAPLWFDFVVPDSSQTGGVYTDVVGTSPNRTFIVEWRDVYEYASPADNATLELLLSEDGTIVFQYQTLNGSDTTGAQGQVGIQNADGSIGLPYSCYQDALTEQRAIRYEVPQAAFFTPPTAQQGGAPGALITYNELLANQTGIDNSFTITPSGNRWATSVSPANTGIVPRGSSVGVTVRVQIPPGTPIGAMDGVTITASASLPVPGAYTATAVLTTSVSTNGVDFAPARQTRSGNYGSPVTYTVQLTNRSGQANSFVLGEEGNSWTTTIVPTQTGSIAANATTPVTVTVNIPQGATLGARDVVTVTATGQQPEPGQYFGVTVITTTAGIWQRQTSMPAPRSRAASVLFPSNNHIYVLGGEYNNGATDLPVEEYDPLANSWTGRANLQVGVSNVGAAAIGNIIYIPGGYSAAQGATQSVLQAYYPLENRAEIITTDPLPAPRFGSGVAAFNGKLYVIGGSDDSLTGTNSVYEYDPARQAGSRWRAKASMPTARLYLGAAVVDGTIYAIGGLPGDLTDLATVEAYNPATDSWSARHSMSLPRGGVAAVGVDSRQPGCGGFLYALGGGWTNYTASAERYNPATDSWQPISTMSVPRRSLFGAYSPITEALVALGGWTGDYQSIAETIQCNGDYTPPPPPTPGPSPSPSPTSNCTISFSDVPPSNTFYASI